MIPAAADLELANTHRLIPSRYSESGTVLSRLTEEDAVLGDLIELDGATNERLLGEEGLLPGISVHELVYGVSYAHIVNAAFTHAGPGGGRFNNSERGAWYCGVERETSIAEVVFHKLRQLEEVDWQEEEVSTFDDYLADFTTRMQDLRAHKPQYKRFLKAGPIPDCYADSQQLAVVLLAQQSNGILYPSVRKKGGSCIVCFRPTLVYNVRQGARLELRLLMGRDFSSSDVREVRVA
ncbi:MULTISPECIES: RES family NAD+ phosphorylase [Acidobacteriaceae]|uniref:RES family NAD+ phosphorylase n=1 Tax=Acidobacteriaceae TaxID=204434 RepID=UPI00131C20F8|nr:MULTISPECIES: RES family NAD+ phosphorylase [Acidobacteriaceae]MDW5265488.1 RES family NAD+ phosphorylase [Edaphobacter sp.]